MGMADMKTIFYTVITLTLLVAVWYDGLKEGWRQANEASDLVEQQLAEREKQIVMLREVVVIAAQRGDLFEHDQIQAEAALAATE